MDKKTLDNKELEKTAGGTGIGEIPLPPLDDPEYRELAQRRAELDRPFSDLLSRLSKDDRKLLLEYMDVAGDLQYRFSQLAWRYGKYHR